jgi:hypothetical protein
MVLLRGTNVVRQVSGARVGRKLNGLHPGANKVGQCLFSAHSCATDTGTAARYGISAKMRVLDVDDLPTRHRAIDGRRPTKRHRILIHQRPGRSEPFESGTTA